MPSPPDFARYDPGCHPLRSPALAITPPSGDDLQGAMASFIPHLWLFPLGLAVGTFGTLIGAGGGFLLLPILAVLYPDAPPQLLTSISLAVVFFNVLSGSAAYARQGRIDFVAGNVFALASIPGAIAGAIVVRYVPRGTFDIIFAVMLLAVSSFLIARPAARVYSERNASASSTAS